MLKRRRYKDRIIQNLFYRDKQINKKCFQKLYTQKQKCFTNNKYRQTGKEGPVKKLIHRKQMTKEGRKQKRKKKEEK